MLFLKSQRVKEPIYITAIFSDVAETVTLGTQSKFFFITELPNVAVSATVAKIAVV